jgi:hypothetical protein
MATFLESFSTDVAKGWGQRIFSPAFAFWAFGFLAVSGQINGIFTINGPSIISAWIKGDWIGVLVGLMMLTVVSSWIAEKLTPFLIKLFEGYWVIIPYFWNWNVTRSQKRYDSIHRKWVELSLIKTPTVRQIHDRLRLDHMLRYYPARSRIMPTRIGNILCAAELKPSSKYGIDSIVCWPRLWLLLPTENRNDLTAARSALDDGVRLWLWSILLLIWSAWGWWIPIVAIISAFISYQVILSAAKDFSDLIESTFDMRRMLLYNALGWPRPGSPEEEHILGRVLSKYLLRGSDESEPKLCFDEKSSAVISSASRHTASKIVNPDTNVQKN